MAECMENTPCQTFQEVKSGLSNSYIILFTIRAVYTSEGKISSVKNTNQSAIIVNKMILIFIFFPMG